MTKDPTYLDLAHCSAAPCREFLFGTDTMGRDIFSMIWYGGRLSLFIGVGSTVISTLLAILFGAVSGLLKTGATGTNVNDVTILLLRAAE